MRAQARNTSAGSSRRWLADPPLAAVLRARAAPCAWLLVSFWLLAGVYSLRKIGGITGDVLGAINQLTVTLVYLVLAGNAAPAQAF